MMRTKFNSGYYRIAAITLLLVINIISACSTKKNTPISIGYHNLTSKYNVHFNGYESYKSGLEKIDKAFKEDYTTILPVFKYGKKSNVSPAISDMRNAIEKGTKVVKRHSITTKPKRKKRGRKMTPKEKDFQAKYEYCKWVDDGYLLVAKGQFHSHDFQSALMTLNYILKYYGNLDIRYETYLWIARAHSELKEFDNAKKYLELLEEEKLIPKKIIPEIELTYADFYLKRKKYIEAIPRLEKAIINVKKKKDRARYKYILAQLYQEAGEDIKASNMYEEVIKMNPPYEMAFSAKINRAISYSGTKKKNQNDIKKQLNKLLKDEKNTEYHDQIFYALANIEYKNDNINEAVEFYKKSSQSSVSNNAQKAISCLALADIHFGRSEYEISSAYYDTTMTNISKTYPDYELLLLKTTYLTALVENLNIVFTQDSLQRWAKMDSSERNERIETIIKDLEKAEALEKQLEQQRQRELLTNMQEFERTNNATKTTGKFYFYNTTSLSKGRNDFIKKWGKRELADNWRRKNKDVVIDMQNDEDNVFEDGDTKNKKLTTKNKDYYLKDVPVNDSLMAISNDKIIKALYEAGEIYKDKLKDYNEATSTYTELNRRYQKNEYLLDTYYSLYQIGKLTNDRTMAAKYKRMIISKFPNSQHAKIFTNPSYLKELKANKDKIENLYEKAYNQYRKENYAGVFLCCNEADDKFPNNHLSMQFVFLKTLAVGGINRPNVDEYTVALKNIITDYPETEIQKLATDILDNMKSGSASIAEVLEIEDTLYKFNDKALHYYILLIKDKTVNTNRTKFNLEEFNLDNYESIDLNVSVTNLNDNEKIVAIKSFENRETVLKYMKLLSANKKVFGSLNRNKIVEFAISSDNYITYFQNKDTERYMRFFLKTY